ncbi:MAG TPA: lactate racemase domain-containing protein [Blastocatellia bacterium]|nr:lactate racemase domain-containing protein [Blastocatellia bacterium]
MTGITTQAVIGRGDVDLSLSLKEMQAIVRAALADVGRGARVLAIIPDKTRDDNTDLLFPFAAEALASRGVAQFDALVAQGTHQPMTEEEKRLKTGAAHAVLPGLGKIYDHKWDQAEELVTIGELSSERVRELTEGLIDRSILLQVNRLLTPRLYDTVLVFGATVPHEVAGFSGGAKYFFPGVSGPELTHVTHWLGALATIENIIGRVETPTRRMIEAAAEFISARVISFNSVVTRDDDGRIRTHALFAGDIREALRQAAEVSRKVHIKYTGRKYWRVVALLDEHYDEMWVGGKASYKLGSIIEDGGELLIHAPHLRSISETHGRLIERYGYAPLEVVAEMVNSSAELTANLCVAAHLAHVSYASRKDDRGRIVPRYSITLASSIDEATCTHVNLGYMDYREFRREHYENDLNTLIVERAGRDLYRVCL